MTKTLLQASVETVKTTELVLGQRLTEPYRKAVSNAVYDGWSVTAERVTSPVDALRLTFLAAVDAADARELDAVNKSGGPRETRTDDLTPVRAASDDEPWLTVAVLVELRLEPLDTPFDDGRPRWRVSFLDATLAAKAGVCEVPAKAHVSAAALHDDGWVRTWLSTRAETLRVVEQWGPERISRVVTEHRDRVAREVQQQQMQEAAIALYERSSSDRSLAERIEYLTPKVDATPPEYKPGGWVDDWQRRVRYWVRDREQAQVMRDAGRYEREWSGDDVVTYRRSVELHLDSVLDSILDELVFGSVRDMNVLDGRARAAQALRQALKSRS